MSGSARQAREISRATHEKPSHEDKQRLRIEAVAHAVHIGAQIMSNNLSLQQTQQREQSRNQSQRR